jgi:hypothetical protein
MLTFTAFIGVGLAGVAYLPQIWHLVHVHCAAGISRFAFRVWLLASLLVTSHAIATRAGVFIILGAVQILATTVILVFATTYSSSDCGSHGTIRLPPIELTVAVFEMGEVAVDGEGRRYRHPGACDDGELGTSEQCDPGARCGDGKGRRSPGCRHALSRYSKGGPDDVAQRVHRGSQDHSRTRKEVRFVA